MARARTTKQLAQRIDLNYFKRSSPFKSATFWLSILLPALAILWIGGRSFLGDRRVYSSGRMSAAHAVLERECGACHVQTTGVFAAKATDSACLSCHDGPVHHSGATKTFACATCHTEHRGRVNITAASNEACGECHGNLRTREGPSHYVASIRSFQQGHPEFAALRAVAGIPSKDPGTIKLNHALHMKPIRRSAAGPVVQLACGDCHRTGAVSAPWSYADPAYTGATPSYSDQEEVVTLTTVTFHPRLVATGRELMAPVKFAYACAGCHSLAFDKRFDEGVPHDKPQVVHEFVIKKFQTYISAHPGEVRVSRGKPLASAIEVLTPAQWVTERTAEAEQLLWRKTCKQCHSLDFSAGDLPPRIRSAIPRSEVTFTQAALSVPRIEHANIVLRWMPHARFDHERHGSFTCTSCHEKALVNRDSTDILIPGIATCQKCHAPGADHAESRCFECHTYHDWSKRQEITPTFTLPALRTGGR